MNTQDYVCAGKTFLCERCGETLMVGWRFDLQELLATATKHEMAKHHWSLKEVTV